MCKRLTWSRKFTIIRYVGKNPKQRTDKLDSIVKLLIEEFYLLQAI
jgi:hypothetical protein